MGTPTVSGASLSGIASGKVKLKFTIKAGTGAPEIRSVTVSLPAGLSFAKVSKKALARGITVRGVKFKARLSGGRLTITFARPVVRASITISSSLLKVSAGLAGKVRRHKVKHLAARLTEVDAKGRAASVALTVNV